MPDMREREHDLVYQDHPGDLPAQPTRATSTARVREHRRRRREGLRLAHLEVRPNEIAFLMRQGLIQPGEEGDPWSLARAVGRLLDLLMPALEAGRIELRLKQ
jgi:hypothetical protein